MSDFENVVEDVPIPDSVPEPDSSCFKEVVVISPLQQLKDSIVPPNNDWSLLDSEQLRELASRVKTTVDFDNGRGDLTLIVKNNAEEEVFGHDDINLTAFKVSSIALVRASRFWEKVFLGPWAEAQPGHNKILNYIEDDPVSLQILLHAIHLQFSRIPPVLSLSGLANLAILTDKFQATSIVGPWMERWLEPLEAPADTDSSMTQWAWVSWEYGLEDIFDKVYHKLCMNMVIEQNGDPLTSGTLPPTIEDRAKESRQNVVTVTLGGIYAYFSELRQVAKSITLALNSLETPDEYMIPISKEYCSQGRRDCVIAQVGSLFCGLENCGLWPEKAPSDILISLQELQETLKRVWVMGCNPLSDRSRHLKYKIDTGICSCGSFRRIVDNMSNASPWLGISEEQRVHLAKQRSLWDTKAICWNEF